MLCKVGGSEHGWESRSSLELFSFLGSWHLYAMCIHWYTHILPTSWIQKLLRQRLHEVSTNALLVVQKVWHNTASFGTQKGLLIPPGSPGSVANRWSMAGSLEERYVPSQEVCAKAYVKSMEEYRKMYQASLEEPEDFWRDMAKELYWQVPFEKVGPDFNFHPAEGPVYVKWFVGGKTNVCYNCLDRNVEKGLGSRVAIYQEGNDLEDLHSCFTYAELLKKVCQLANALKAEGVQKGLDFWIHGKAAVGRESPKAS